MYQEGSPKAFMPSMSMSPQGFQSSSTVYVQSGESPTCVPINQYSVPLVNQYAAPPVGQYAASPSPYVVSPANPSAVSPFNPSSVSPFNQYAISPVSQYAPSPLSQNPPSPISNLAASPSMQRQTPVRMIVAVPQNNAPAGWKSGVCGCSDKCCN